MTMLLRKAILCGGMAACVVVGLHGQDQPKREEKIVVSQPAAGESLDEAKGRAVVTNMVAALGGERWLKRGDYVMKGHTSSFYQNSAKGVTDFWQFHHVLPDGRYEDRIELTKKRDFVQMWTPTEGVEITYKGRTALPKESQAEYFRRQRYTLDAIATAWINAPGALIVYGGTSIVAQRQAESVTIIDTNNDSVQLDVEAATHLPLRRIFKFRDATYKDFNEDVEEYSDFHEYSGVMVPSVTTRYYNGDMVSQRFVEQFEFKPVDAGLFGPGAPLGKHSY